MDSEELERRKSAVLQHVLQQIEDFGWIVQSVAPAVGTPAAERPPKRCSYTVGLTAMGSPEFVVFGLTHPNAQGLLNDLSTRQKRGAGFEAGDFVYGLVPDSSDYRLLLVPVPDPARVPMACAIYGEERVSALQVVFQDVEYRWPWEPGSKVARLPLLGPVSEEAKRVASS